MIESVLFTVHRSRVTLNQRDFALARRMADKGGVLMPME